MLFSIIWHKNQEALLDDSYRKAGKTEGADLSTAFATFFGDVEYEVAEVNSAYRVALTYNIYYTDVRPSTNLRSSFGLMVQEESGILHHLQTMIS
ncbi:hypothetical protein BJ912DRAFT_975231 [Pholiota molesta]|nr:hypothetical protein BJ912DRAFT_975231 [Pholiota molesta]